MAHLAVLLTWLTDRGESVGWYLHSPLVRLMGSLGPHEGTNHVCCDGTSSHVLPHDAKPSREL